MSSDEEPAGCPLKIRILPDIVPYVDPIPLSMPTTTVIKVDAATGQFSPFDAAILLPHEPLRVEFLRFTRVLPHVAKDIGKNKEGRWRLRRLTEYYWDLLLPFLEDHHTTEEEIVAPHYKALGDNSLEVFYIPHSKPHFYIGSYTRH
jgi:hypothetical protein